MAEASLVHIIDDDASIRRTLEKLFASVDMQSRSYSTAQAFLDEEAIRDYGSECIVLDVRMPGVSGLDFQNQLASSDKSLPVIMVTGHADVPMSVRAMKAGAVDFLAKPFRDQELLEAVTIALEVDRRRRCLVKEDARIRTLYATLSPRERQTMRMVTAGQMNKQIADDLSLSMITVKIHRKHAMRKMEAKTLADLVRMAAVLGLHQNGKDNVVPLAPAEAAAATLAIRTGRNTPRLRLAG